MFLFKSCFKNTETESVNEVEPATSSANKSENVGLCDINCIKVLSKGQYGDVMLAAKRDTEEFYAFKAIRKDKIIKDAILEIAINELRVMMTLNAENSFFTSFFSYFETSKHFFFVMEFENCGNLLFHLRRSRMFNEERSAFYAAETTLALQFLHRKGIIYRDLQLSNIYLDRSGHCKLIDFSLPKVK